MKTTIPFYQLLHVYHHPTRQNNTGSFGLSIKLQVIIPETSKHVAQELMEKAQHVCPYSDAIRGNKVEPELI